MNALIRCPHDAMVWLGSFTWLSAEPMSVKAQKYGGTLSRIYTPTLYLSATVRL